MRRWLATVMSSVAINCYLDFGAGLFFLLTLSKRAFDLDLCPLQGTAVHSNITMMVVMLFTV